MKNTGTKKILLVDDNHDLVESITEVLELNGCTVDKAYDGEEAVNKFKKSDYDFALIDIKLPGMNGVDSYLEIKKLKPRARVAMMTGFSLEKLIEKAKHNGAVDILYKPIEIEKLLDLIY